MNQTREFIEFCAKGVENNRRQHSCILKRLKTLLESPAKLPSLFPSAVSTSLISSTAITSQSQIYTLHLTSLQVSIHFTLLSTRPVFLDGLFHLVQCIQNKIIPLFSHICFSFCILLFSVSGDDITILPSFAQAPNLSFLLTLISLCLLLL